MNLTVVSKMLEYKYQTSGDKNLRLAQHQLQKNQTQSARTT
jgi:hypothetical protein